MEGAPVRPIHKHSTSFWAQHSLRGSQPASTPPRVVQSTNLHTPPGIYSVAGALVDEPTLYCYQYVVGLAERQHGFQKKEQHTMGKVHPHQGSPSGLFYESCAITNISYCLSSAHQPSYGSTHWKTRHTVHFHPQPAGADTVTNNGAYLVCNVATTKTSSNETVNPIPDSCTNTKTNSLGSTRGRRLARTPCAPMITTRNLIPRIKPDMNALHHAYPTIESATNDTSEEQHMHRTQPMRTGEMGPMLREFLFG